ncbi:MAG: CoA-acylating methylmalonate-semialdehyde dehydrogenase [Acidimicrobiales bacterium]|jgi:malonate-semialdehyde dehydrogenase (acetylating)/methylmalonate-semialdehyde dehydrogenase|nr:CoA-acylating methylmalonate-semialdehyde dehydrogenase [Acidimicrobiales bacterium]MDP6298828.1 CoA-acylating methylmalonate-semialdehyde dehydrogenase [Acidimicrobiales bacterium]HJM27736.1 CoA-acylating methylmalonate-semialdehyde dehydrogenase [Acidimicrobiales bacterium]HJM97200.1 CoA-acylating methylmalonate-semialdehyde dehydrogenase [Acidimicrobiales bacterium]
MRQIHHQINGQNLEALKAGKSVVLNPATGEQVAEAAVATNKEIDLAVSTAKTSFKEWKDTSIAHRTKLLHKFRNLVVQNERHIAELITEEHGKVIEDARGEVARGIENIEYACGFAETLKGSYSEQASTGVDVYTLRQPVGVCAGITPFNFPIMVPLWMLPNAIACGNTFILKPSDRNPSAPGYLVELIQEAGFPPGVVNLINGNEESVNLLLSHPDVEAISFVGSTPVAKHVYTTGTSKGKRVQALGGAKNHMVVLPDADIDLAADAAVSAAYGSAGERCMAISVVVAVGEIADPLVEAIAKRIKGLTIGPGMEPESEMGPLISQDHRDRVISYLESAEKEGAVVVTDGRTELIANPGFFIGATLLDNVTTEMNVYQDEIFGPVLCTVRVSTFDQAVNIIENNRYGNGVAIFTRDGGAARQFQKDVQAGMVGINVPIPVPVGYHSFGGWNDSLFGDAAMYGPEGMHFFTKQKVVTSRWPDPTSSQIDLGFPRNT